MLMMAVICIASCERSWNGSFHTSGPHWLAISQGRWCDLALMRIEMN